MFFRYIRLAFFPLLTAVPICAQISAPATPHSREVALVVPAGTPLRVALISKVPVKSAGTPVSGRLVESVYAFDKEVIPAGSTVSGRIKALKPMSGRKRARAIIAGDFTPIREPQVEFDIVTLKNGTRLPIHTEVSLGARYPVQIQSAAAKVRKKRGRAAGVAIARAKQEISARTHGAIDIVKGPGKWERLKEMAWSRSPYRPQFLPAGARFNADLQQPLTFGSESVSSADLAQVGSLPAAGSVVHANLLTRLDSATVQKNTPIEAVLSEPLFTANHHLVFPQGSRLRGTVVKTQPARFLHRNGQLRFNFQRIEPPPSALPEPEVMAAPAAAATAPPPHDAQMALKTRSEAATRIEGSLEGAEMNRNAHLKIDSEGGTQVSESKWRYVTPALSVLLATSALHQEHERDGDIENNTTAEAASGGVSFGVLGTGLGLTSRYVGAGLGFYGAGWSIYTRFIARGQDIVFPKDASVVIRFGRN